MKNCWAKHRLTNSIRQLLKCMFTFEWKERPNISDIINNDWFDSSFEKNEYYLRPRKQTFKGNEIK